MPETSNDLARRTVYAKAAEADCKRGETLGWGSLVHAMRAEDAHSKIVERDHGHLERIFGAVLKPSSKHGVNDLLSYQFDDGTRLSLLCGPTGRLNGVVIDREDNDDK